MERRLEKITAENSVEGVKLGEQQLRHVELCKNRNQYDGLVGRRMCKVFGDNHCKEEETDQKRVESCSGQWWQQVVVAIMIYVCCRKQR